MVVDYLSHFGLRYAFTIVVPRIIALIDWKWLCLCDAGVLWINA